METNDKVERGHYASRSHVTLIVCCVTVLATEAAIGGIYLHKAGFAQGAGLTFLVLNTAISGLIGFLGGRSSIVPTNLAGFQLPMTK